MTRVWAARERLARPDSGYVALDDFELGLCQRCGHQRHEHEDGFGRCALHRRHGTYRPYRGSRASYELHLACGCPYFVAPTRMPPGLHAIPPLERCPRCGRRHHPHCRDPWPYRETVPEKTRPPRLADAGVVKFATYTRGGR